MLVAGDEFGRTQQGNNNAYCQDNEISWLDWVHADQDLLTFTRRLIALRKTHPVFCRRGWFQGQPIRGVGLEDIAWFQHDGSEMSEEHWNHDFAKSLAVYLNGHGIHALNEKGERMVDDSFYVIFNAHFEPIDFRLPAAKYGKKWQKVLDTDQDQETRETYAAEAVIAVQSRSVVVLQHCDGAQQR